MRNVRKLALYIVLACITASLAAVLVLAIIHQARAADREANYTPDRLSVLVFTTPVDGRESVFLRRLRSDPRSLDIHVVEPTSLGSITADVTDLDRYDVYVIDSFLPSVPILDEVADAVKHGSGLLFRVSVDYSDATFGHEGRLAALEQLLPVSLQREGMRSVTVPPPKSSTLIPIGADQGSTGHPIVSEIGWRSAPSVPIVALTPPRDPGAQILVRELSSAQQTAVLCVGQLGLGRVLVLSTPIESKVNEYLSDWPYFKYLLYLSIKTLGGAEEYQTYGTWSGSPETLTPVVRAVLLGVLGLFLVATAIWLTVALRRSRQQPLTVSKLELVTADEQEGARLGPWERTGFHKALSGHMFQLTVNLATSVFVILTMLYFLPVYVTPDPSILGLDYVAAALFSFVFALADFGTFSALGRFLGEHNVRDPERTVKYVQIFVTFQLVTGLLQTTLIWVFAIYVLPVTRQFSFMAWSFILKGLIQWPGMLWVFKDTLNGLQKYDYVVWITVGNYALEWITWVGSITLFRGLLGDVLTDTIAGQLGSAVGSYVDDIITTFLSLYLLNRVRKAWATSACFRIDFGVAQMRETLVFGGKVLLGGLSVIAVNFAITLLKLNTVYNYLYVSAFVGLAAQTRFQVAEQGRIIIDNLYAPIAEAYNNGKRALTRYYVSHGLKWFVTSTAPVYLVGVVLLPALLRDILPLVYQDVAWMVAVLVAVMPLLPLDGLLRNVLLGSDRAGVYTWATAAEQAVRLAAYAAALPAVGPAAQIWVLLLGDSPAKLIKIAGLWAWIHRRLLQIRVHLYQTLIAPLVAGGLYLGMCALGMLALRRATIGGKLGLTALDAAVLVVCLALVVRRPTPSATSLVRDRRFSAGLLLGVAGVLVTLVWLGGEFYYVSLIMTLVVFLPMVLYFPLLGALGSWDAHGLEQFALAADEAGLAYALYYPAYTLTARLCRRSVLYNRFPIPHIEAQAEAAELDRLRTGSTYRLSVQA